MGFIIERGTTDARGLLGLTPHVLTTRLYTRLTTRMTMTQHGQTNLGTGGERALTEGQEATELMQVTRTLVGLIGTTTMGTTERGGAEFVATMRWTR